MSAITLVFVHGYSVTNLDTYGEMPLRIKNEAAKRGIEVHIEDIFLGRYISFSDEVRLNDISKALETAIQQQILSVNPGRGRFVCITHSTGGPVVRNWWYNFYRSGSEVCPISHLIMLAPANHGSSLAQLGKSKLSRIKSWFDGVEPGQGVLDWLELGSTEAWELNKSWIYEDRANILRNGFFPFVLTGQSIDRKLYDHLNSYTGEIGSDGVVRVASANLNSVYLKLTQPLPVSTNGKAALNDFEISDFTEAPKTALRIVTNKSHSGDSMGILKSVKESIEDHNSDETINAVFNCINVQNAEAYNNLCNVFEAETANVQQNLKVEKEKFLLGKRVYIHDRYCMLIFRVRDSEGYALTNFDLLLTAGDKDDPDFLPTGFFADRQCNRVNKSTITYFLNYDIMAGCGEVTDENGEVLRAAQPGIDKLGMIIYPRPEEGFIRYAPCRIKASKELFEKVLKPNSTTMIDICLKRLVSTEVFRFEALEGEKKPSKNFKNTKPGNEVIS